MFKTKHYDFHGWGVYILINILFFLILMFVMMFSINSAFKTYPGILIAMSSGFLGATFSMLIQNQERVSKGSLEDLTAASSWHALIVRGSVGLGAAVILYFFFESGLLEGSLWPNLKELGYNSIKLLEHTNVPNKHWCLLIIWCFLAGFSESLVPNMLHKTEQKGASI
jgi:hypothetical protein